MRCPTDATAKIASSSAHAPAASVTSRRETASAACCAVGRSARNVRPAGERNRRQPSNRASSQLLLKIRKVYCTRQKRLSPVLKKNIPEHAKRMCLAWISLIATNRHRPQKEANMR